MRRFCGVHIFDTILSIFYGILFLTSWRLVVRHRLAITSGNATGLSCYLICSAFFCIYRTLSLWILILIDHDCSHSYGSDGYLDVIDLVNNKLKRLRYMQFMLASLALTFFYTSYTYFAYSLTKVLDMLTSIHHDVKALKSNSHFLNVYIGITLAMWISVTFIWVISMSEEKAVGYLYIWARIANASSALLITVYVSFYLIQAYLFVRQHGKDSGRGHQLYGLLTMRRIQGVCFVSVIVFALRWIILVFQIEFQPIVSDFFLLFSEILPTAFMLFVFRSNISYDTNILINEYIKYIGIHSSGDGQVSTSHGPSEVQILKASITSSFVSAMKTKSLFSTSLDEEDDDDDYMEDISRLPLAADAEEYYELDKPDVKPLLTGLESYWESSSILSNRTGYLNLDSNLSNEKFDL